MLISFHRPPNKQVAVTLDVTSPQRVTIPEQRNSPKSPTLLAPSQNHPTLAPLTKHARLPSDSALTSASESTGPWYSDSSSTSLAGSSAMSIFSNRPTPPHNITVPSATTRSYSNDSNDSSTTIQRSQPKSPGGSKLGTFFGWGSSSPSSSTTSFSEKSYSPIPSPQTSEHFYPPSDASKSVARNPPTAIDVPKANANADGYFGNAYLQLPLATPSSPVQIEEMEKELKDISSELASSIRREMDLEDLVERLQSESQNPTNMGKRTSDYFSDSGTSSVKYGESDSRQDELDRLIRKTEQEKAQMRLELTDKVQDERYRRKQLEVQIRTLEERASHVGAPAPP